MPNNDWMLRLQVREGVSIRFSINNAWKKPDEYYTKLGDSPMFTAAVTLSPGLGLRWISNEAQFPKLSQMA